MVMSRQKNSGENHNLIIANKCFENVAKLEYMGRRVTDQNCIQEEINNVLHSGNSRYHSIQNLLLSSLPSTNLKIKVYKTIFLHVVLYRCAT
jgi:asparagine synthetase A